MSDRNILQETLTPYQQASLFYAGVLVIMLLGMIAAAALIIAALWVVSQVLILALESIIQAAHTLTIMYQESGPFVEFCLLVALSFAVYQMGKRILARRASHA